MDKQQFFEWINDYNQGHVLAFWDQLSRDEQSAFFNQVSKIDFELLNGLFKKATSDSGEIDQLLETTKVISLRERKQYDPSMIKIGEDLIKNGQVAAFLVAGGQGSRLGFEGPKGAYPITPVKRKPLFQLHAEKIIAMRNTYNAVIPWYIMTSVTNHQQTISFFEENKFFGFNKDDVIFFSQEMIPALDYNGKLLLEEKGRIFMNPNGHGGSLKAIWDSGAYEDMVKRGVTTLFYFQVDNVLTYICDPAFLGYHKKFNSEMSCKVVRKAYPEEKIGIICKINGKVGVVEYSDLSDEYANSRDRDGELKFWAGSIAIHVLETDFIKKINEQGFKLPYHIAEKKIPYLDQNGNKVNPDKNVGYKFETFVFDALHYCQNTISMEVDRTEEFSPVKNKTGIDSEESAIRDLCRFYLKWLKNAGINVPEVKNEVPKIEISPLFAVTEQGLKNKKEEIPPFSNNYYLE